MSQGKFEGESACCFSKVTNKRHRKLGGIVPKTFVVRFPGIFALPLIVAV